MFIYRMIPFTRGGRWILNYFSREKKHEDFRFVCKAKKNSSCRIKIIERIDEERKTSRKQ